jgi:hypothetical protein
VEGGARQRRERVIGEGHLMHGLSGSPYALRERLKPRMEAGARHSRIGREGWAGEMEVEMGEEASEFRQRWESAYRVWVQNHRPGSPHCCARE